MLIKKKEKPLVVQKIFFCKNEKKIEVFFEKLNFFLQIDQELLDILIFIISSTISTLIFNLIELKQKKQKKRNKNIKMKHFVFEIVELKFKKYIFRERESKKRF